LTYESLGTGALAKVGIKGVGAARALLPRNAANVVDALAARAQDVFTHGGAAKRAVGQEGLDHAIGAMSKHATRDQLRTTVLTKRFGAIRGGLSNDEWADVLRIRNGELPHGEVPPVVLERAKALKSFTDQLQELRGGERYRENYIPGLRDAEEVATDRAGHSHNLLDRPLDVHEIQRDRFAVDPARLDEHTAAFHGAIRSASRQQMARGLEEELGAKYGRFATATGPGAAKVPDAVRALFDRASPATGAMRGDGQVLGDAWRGVVGLPKSAIVGTSPRHIFNIADLLSQHSVAALPEALVNAARISMKPAARGDILSKGIELGAISPSAERDAPVVDFLGKLGIVGKVAAKPLRAMNDLTWHFDDAAVQALAKKYEKAGYKGYSAGRQARRDLVDYEHVSPFTKALKNAAPFAVFNSQIPGAVVRAIGKDPAQAAVRNRLTDGLYYGGEVDTPDGKHIRLYNPTAEIGRADPAAFARKTIADPVRFGVDFAGATAEGKRHFFEYGHDTHDPKEAAKLLLNALLGGVPGAREALQQSGAGVFKKRDWVRDLIQGSTGVGL